MLSMEMKSTLKICEIIQILSVNNRHLPLSTTGAGDDLEISIEVISTTGRLIKKISYIIEDSPTRITGLEWDSSEQNGSNILGGVYIFKVGVRSLVDGSKKVANHKFVIIN
jgi:hypothetical protein